MERKSMSMAERLQAEVDERQTMQRSMQASIDELNRELKMARQAALEGRGLELAKLLEFSTTPRCAMLISIASRSMTAGGITFVDAGGGIGGRAAEAFGAKI